MQPQTQAPQQAPAQAQAPTQPQGKQYPAYVRFKYNTNTIDRVFTQEELNKKIAAGNAKEDEYNPVNERGEIMQDDGGVYDMLKFNSLNHDANLMKKLRGLNIPIKGDSYTQSQAQPAQPAQAPPTQPVVGESKSWEDTKELGNIYDTMLYESMNPNMDDPKDLILHIRHAKKMGDYQKVKSLTDRLRKVAMRMDMLDDPEILDIIG